MREYIGAKLHSGQQKIADQIINTLHIDGVIQYHVVCCSRQFGKSFLLTQLILYYAINEPNSKVLFVSMSYQQANKVFNNLIKGIEKSKIIKKKNGAENSIILTNDSEIYIRSYQRPDLIRGLSATTLIIDEAAWIKDEDWQGVFRPTLSTEGKRGLLFSTPRGRNYFYEMAMKGLSGEYPNYHYYHSTYRENPLANLGEIEDAKKSLPEKIFRTEYEAEFVSGAMSVFENVKNCIKPPRKPIKPTIGSIDVGRQDDYTVFTIMQDSDVVYQGAWRLESWSGIISHILEAAKNNKVKTIYVEVNGLGDPFYEMLINSIGKARLSISVKPWVTSNSSKQNIIEQLIEDFSTGNIAIPDDHELLEQLENFECEYSPKSRAVKYGGRPPFHDDRVMSLAICNFHKTNGQRGGYFHTCVV